jgi:hypothetical protein
MTHMPKHLIASAIIAVAACEASAAYVDVVTADSPVGYYRLNEPAGATTAADSAAPAQNGTYTNFASSAFQKDGIEGGGGDKSVLFDGSNDRIPAIGGVLVTSDQTYTLEVWINIGTGTPQAGYALSFHRGNTDNRYHALGITSAGMPVMSQQQAGSIFNITGTTALNDGEWHHLVGVFGSSGGAAEDRFYVDGTQIGTIDGPTEDGATSVISVGVLETNSTPTGHFKGHIDEVAVYNAQLTADRVLAHYQAGVPEPTALAAIGTAAALLIRRRSR